MEKDFKYIKNRIGEHAKDDLLECCFNILDSSPDKHLPIWDLFILMKWAYLYGDNKYPPKLLNQVRLNRILTAISNFNPNHITSFIHDKKIDKSFQILFNQQFYLQKNVYTGIMEAQLKLFSNIRSKYDVEESFTKKTGLSIFDFLFIQKVFWLYVNLTQENESGISFSGFIGYDFLELASVMTSPQKVDCFLKLLTLDSMTAQKRIAEFKHGIKNEELQTLEMSFFTMYPFHVFKGKIKLVHISLLKYNINYYLYDFLKANDCDFTTEFGHRLEKYIMLGLDEIKAIYKTENEIKKLLPEKSKLVDFFIPDSHIFIESKAIELQAYPYVNPTDELLYNSLKTSIFKAYFEQLVPAAKEIGSKIENWGIIITYKEMFWSKFSSLFEIGRSKYPSSTDYQHLPPENVYIIDIYTWDKIIQIIKEGKATLLEILMMAKENNSKFETSKLLFGMHLDIYDSRSIDLQYLYDETKQLDIKARN